MNPNYKELLESQNGKCAICGAEDKDLVFEHIFPKSLGGEDTQDNLILVCKQHNSSFANRPIRGFEFTEFVYRIFKESGQFLNVNREFIQFTEKKNKADLFVEEQKLTGVENLEIEIKPFSNFTNQRIDEIITQILSYKTLDNAKQVFMFPGYISNADNLKFALNAIEVWDLKYLSKRFKKELAKTENVKFLNYFNFSLIKEYDTEEEELIAELKNIKPGREQWSSYQKHIGKILEYLFGEKLSSPISESSDEFKVNRRDYILRNYSDDKFWKYLRESYFADFVVIDAKNYNAEVKKNEVIQIANYLKKHGTGLFALIITRVGEKNSSYITRREKWILENKMIVVLTDEDIEKMILAKSSSNDPEEIIKQSIEDFRLKI